MAALVSVSQKLSGGYANTNLRINTTTGSYLLKICNEKPFEALKPQIDFLLQCTAAGVFTAYPVEKSCDAELLHCRKLPVMVIMCYNGVIQSLSMICSRYYGSMLALTIIRAECQQSYQKHSCAG